jgi:hypothetical protein
MSDIKSHVRTTTRPQTAAVTAQSPLSRIARRTRGQSHGPITRLMSPSDFGRLLKPFVFLDPSIPAGGVTASGYGREDGPGGPDDFLETQSLFLGPDRASERCDAR